MPADTMLRDAVLTHLTLVEGPYTSVIVHRVGAQRFKCDSELSRLS